MTVLGEQIRIGDILLQERPNYESRKLCTLKASQGALLKGQILGVLGGVDSGPVVYPGVMGDVQKSELVKLVVGVSDVQTLTIAGSTGVFNLRYKGVISAVATVGTTTLAQLQAIIRAMHPDLAGLTVTDSNGSASSTAIGASYAVILTTTAANMVTANAEVIETFDIVGDTSWKVASASVVAPITIVHTTVGYSDGAGARAILLQDVANSGSTQTVLCAVREAKLKPDWLLYRPTTGGDRSTEAITSAQKAAILKNLEKYGLVITADSATFASSQDVDLAEAVTLPTSTPAGL